MARVIRLSRNQRFLTLDTLAALSWGLPNSITRAASLKVLFSPVRYARFNFNLQSVSKFKIAVRWFGKNGRIEIFIDASNRLYPTEQSRSSDEYSKTFSKPWSCDVATSFLGGWETGMWFLRRPISAQSLLYRLKLPLRPANNSIFEHL